jgi:Mor family transcriptional regulator
MDATDAHLIAEILGTLYIPPDSNKKLPAALREDIANSDQSRDSVQDILAKIQAHNDSVQRKHVDMDQANQAEMSIYDVSQRLEQLKAHLKYSAMKYGKKNGRLKLRLQRAQANGDENAYQEIEQEKRILNHHNIFQEFQDGLLADLKYRLQVSEEMLIKIIRNTHEAMQAYESYSSSASTTPTIYSCKSNPHGKQP